MFTHRKSLTIVGILAASLTLAACAPSDAENGSDSSATSAEGFNEQDVTFAQQMVPHHQQAVEMSDMILGKEGIDPRVTDIATSIKDAQEPELDEMNGWLADWDADSMTGMGGMDDGMSGMMSDDEMGELDAASGDDASRLFLEQMTEHHEEAIEMAQTEIDEGEYPAAVELAETIVATQQAEIDQMAEILAAL